MSSKKRKSIISRKIYAYLVIMSGLPLLINIVTFFLASDPMKFFVHEQKVLINYIGIAVSVTMLLADLVLIWVLNKKLPRSINALLSKFGEIFTAEEMDALRKISGDDAELLKNTLDYFSSKSTDNAADMERVNAQAEASMSNSNYIFIMYREDTNSFIFYFPEYWEKTYGTIEIKPNDKLENYVVDENLPILRNSLIMVKSKPDRRFSIAVRMRINHHNTILVNIRCCSIAGENGKVIVMGAIIDAETKRRLEAEISEKYNMYKFVLATVPDIVYEVYVPTGKFTLLNPDAWYELFDVDVDSGNFEESRRPFWTKIHPDYREAFLDRFMSYDHILLLPDKSLTFEYRVMNRNGDWVWIEHSVKVVSQLENGKPLTVIGRMCNINERKRRELKRMYQSDHDALTGTYLRSAIRRKFDTLAADNNHPVIINVDIKDFRIINEQYGMEIGDHVLRKLAEILWSCQRDKSSVARVSGDNFIYLIDDGTNVTAEYIEKICTKITARFNEPMHVKNRTVNVAVAIGVAFFGDDGLTFDEVYTCSEAAARYSAQRGDNRFTFYTNDMAGLKQAPPPKDDDSYESDSLMTDLHNTTR